MYTLNFDISKKYDGFKIMNAVNNGPIHKRHANDQSRSNLEDYKAAGIPYARNHDASFCSSYGSEHTVDISAIFPDFSKDPYDPENYDFAITDEYILVTNEADAETFYRFGQKIEHYIKKYNIYPPKDFKKWAIICEHIIRHYNEGWANGFYHNMMYWEIWNEPDLDDEQLDPENKYRKRTWAGTRAEFYDLFEITAKHLKECFPNLKIGGPSLAGSIEYAEDFVHEMANRKVPMDFFSWHDYTHDIYRTVEKAEAFKEILVKNGYENTESINAEWNYIDNWFDKFTKSIETIIGIKGAAFTMAYMTASQKTSVDMLMYYDARPCAFNGLFDYYTLRPIKGYYPFKWYSMFYKMKNEIRCENEPEDIYTLCGCDENEKLLSVVTYYVYDEDAKSKEIKIDFNKESEYEIYLLDENHDAELVNVTNNLTFTIEPNTCVMIKEK